MANWSKLQEGIPISKWQIQIKKTILLEQAYEDIKEICIKFQEEYGASDMEIKTLLRELARVWEKEN